MRGLCLGNIFAFLELNISPISTECVKNVSFMCVFICLFKDYLKYGWSVQT